MPPGSRSSSSRSSSSSSRSSSRSSSHSSSSRSYSSSSSHSYSSHSSGSSYRSSPSRHSASSHRPSFHSTGSHTTPLPGGVPIRGRSKQPTGYTRNTPGYQMPTTYHCRHHDYVYYAFGWTDTDTGRTYEPGYYDEDGKYYDEVAFKDPASGILTMKCEYCGSEVKTKWTEGVQPNCPNCGAGLKVEKADEILTSYKESPSVTTGADKKGKWHPVLMVFMGFMLLGSILDKEPVIFFLAAAILVVTSPFVNKHLSKGALIWTCVGIVLFSSLLVSITSDEGNTGIVSNDSSFYVEALGRSCKWYDEYDSYYDKETDCYFAYYDDAGTWQYWYEGISSDFGDYGWMEYDEKENQWYIEASKGNWVTLPGKYDTANLWYISDSSVQAAQAEPAKYQNINSGSFYVDALERSCKWSDEYESYYDKETDCYFWYNTNVSPGCWQYWYEGISSDFGDYGWMEYDEVEAQWYIEASNGNWIVLPKGYSTDNLWHIDN